MKIYNICIVVAFILIALLIVFLGTGITMQKVRVSDINDATITFVYIDKNINEKLTGEEVEILKNIVNGKRLWFDDGGWSHGFTPDISFRFDDMIFSVANDTCAIIKLDKHKYKKDSGMYFSVTEEEKQKIYDIFKKYGGYFPCI